MNVKCMLQIIEDEIECHVGRPNEKEMNLNLWRSYK